MREYQSGGDGAGNATCGPGLVFEGKLSFQGQVRFDGTFTGEITTDDLLIIGETAKVSADITCGSVVINGEVNGKIKARDSVELRGHARVKADLVTQSLVMDKGVVFDDYCDMMDKRDIVSLPSANGDERRKSWQAGGRGNKHQARRARDARHRPPGPRQRRPRSGAGIRARGGRTPLASARPESRLRPDRERKPDARGSAGRRIAPCARG